jgi:hypothetical protein
MQLICQKHKETFCNSTIQKYECFNLLSCVGKNCIGHFFTLQITGDYVHYWRKMYGIVQAPCLFNHSLVLYHAEAHNQTKRCNQTSRHAGHI